jgi:hypothetical protein
MGVKIVSNKKEDKDWKKYQEWYDSLEFKRYDN